MVATSLFGSFLLMLIFGVPIAVTIGLSSVLGLAASGLPLSMIPVNYYAASSKFVLLAIPFFILGGNIMGKAGISNRLIDFAQTFVGHRKGGLAAVCVISACFFAAISGSAPATVAALAPLIIPAMIDVGYDRADATALISVAGVIGLIIPPSILFVVYGSITGVSISKLFMSGFFPGIIMGSLLILTNFYLNRNTPLKLVPKASVKERWVAFKEAIWAILMPVIILGGIFSGVFTPTEAAGVSAVYGLVVGVFVYRSITLKLLYEIVIESAKQTATVMFVTAAASLLAWVVTVEGYAQVAVDLLIAVSGSKLTILLIMINIILLIAGCLIDGTSNMYLFVPIIFAAAVELGYDPIALGTLATMNLAIGNATPPVGVCLYVGCSVGDVTLKEISVKAFPYVIVSIIALFIITFFPQISLFLPNMLL